GGIIRRGFDRELDRLYTDAHEGKDWMAKFQAAEMTRTGIPSLKVGYNQVHGYYIEITHTHKAKVPQNYNRVGTLKNAERYDTPERRERAETVLTPEAGIFKREYELFVPLRDGVANQAPRLLATAEVRAPLDVLAGLAERGVSRHYRRPTLVDEPVL